MPKSLGRSAGLRLLFAAVPFLLAGCGANTPLTAPDATNVAFGGRVHGGQQPVSGSNISLYATTSAGYNGTPNLLASTTSDGNGNFKISTTYTCPAGQQAYIVAAGGNPGLTSATKVDSSAIFLVAALGSCSNVTASSYIVINEVSTIAAAYAMSGFAPAGGAGMIEGSITGGFTTSATNTQGLADAAANAINIVASNSGVPNASTVGGNGVVPASTLNSLADILQDCVNSSTPGATACTNLFSAAQPPTGTAIAKPVNVFQAALDIAQYPGNNVSTLFGLISPVAAFAPTLTTAPNDWTVGITYTSSQIAAPLGLGIDNNDNVYVTGSTGANLAELSPQGTVLSPNASGTAQGGFAPSLNTSKDNIRNVAFDLSGNLFLSDGNATDIYEYTPGGTATAPTLGTLTPLNYAAVNTDANNYNVAVDALGDVYTTSYKKSTCGTTTKACQLVEFVKGAATPYMPVNTFSSAVLNSPGFGGARGLAFDVNTGNFWQTDIVENIVSLFKLTPSATAAAASTGSPALLLVGNEASSPTTNNYGSVAVAIDKSSNAWVVVQGGPAVTTGTDTTAAIAAGLFPITSAGSVGAAASNAVTASAVNGGLTTPAYLTIDGNNNIFVANNTNSSTAFISSVVEYSPGYNTNAGAFLSPNIGFSPGTTYANGTLTGGTLYQASYVAVDRSGALWVLSSGTGTGTSLANVVQILGVAGPTDPVLAKGQYGVKP